MNCPNCGLINPETATRCDCGYDFIEKRIKKSYLYEENLNKEEWLKTGLINQAASSLIFLTILIGPVFLLSGIIGKIPIEDSLIAFSFCGLIGLIFYCTSPIALKVNDQSLTIKLLFNKLLKYSLRNVKGIYELNFMYKKTAIILTKYLIFVIESVDMEDYEVMKNKIEYWLTKQKQTV